MKFNKIEPLVAKATRIDKDTGKEIGDKELLKLEIPLEEDIENFEIAIENKIRNNEVRKDIIGKVEIENEKGEYEMDDKQVESLVNKKLNELEIQKQIDAIEKISTKVLDKQLNIESQLGRFDTKIESQIDQFDTKIESQIDQFDTKIKSQIDQFDNKMVELKGIVNKYNKDLMSSQEEACSGVECIKASFDELKQKTDKMNNDLELLKSESKNVLCSGKHGCNAKIPAGSTFCPNCGSKITSWKGIPGWVPFDERD